MGIRMTLIPRNVSPGCVCPPRYLFPARSRLLSLSQLEFPGAPHACQVGAGLGAAATASGHRLGLLQGLTGLGASASARQRLGPPAASVRSRAQLDQGLDVSASAWQRRQDLRESTVWHRPELIPLRTNVSNKQEENVCQSSDTGSFAF